MINNIQEIIRKEGWQQGQMVETDVWIGSRSIHHFTRVMVINDTTIYGESDGYIFLDTAIFSSRTSNESHHYYNNELCVYATSKAQAKIDIVTLNGINKDILAEKTKEANVGVNKALGIITDLYDKLGYRSMNSVTDNLREHIEDDEFTLVVNFINNLGFYKYDYCPDDVIANIANIHRKNGFYFEDKGEANIHTFVSLDHIASVQTDCKYSDKQCVAIKMDNGKLLKVNKEDDADLYQALYELFN